MMSATTKEGRRDGAAMEGAPLVLVVEDEPRLQKLLRATLVEHGYRALEATSGAQAIALASSEKPDLVLLDLGLPDLDGVEVTRRLREWMTAPILIISARGQEVDKVHVLDAGANDYVTKPFGTAELLARIRVWLRQAARAGESATAKTLEIGDVRIDLVRRLVYVRGAEIHLTPTEYKLLSTLMRNAGCVLTHQKLLETVWGPAYANETQYLRVYMGQLRHKLEVDPARPRRLVTEAGVGYRLRED